MSTEDPAPRAPTSRRQRAAETRARLLDASATLLTARGYSRVATAAVAEEAGVAHGTLFKHFATKSELMAATAEFVLDTVMRDFLQTAAASGVDDESIDRALEALWAVFRSDRLQATLELYVAARTDESLRTALRPMFDRHRTAFLEAARAFLPKGADRTEFESNVTGILATLLGGAVLWSVAPEPEFFQSELAFVERVARGQLPKSRRRKGST